MNLSQMEARMFFLITEISEKDHIIRTAKKAEVELAQLRQELVELTKKYQEAITYENLYIQR